MLEIATCWIACRSLLYLSLMIMSGIAFFIAYIAPPRLGILLSRSFQRFFFILSLIIVVQCVFLFFIQSALIGDGWQDAISPEINWTLLQTRFGILWCAQVIGALGLLYLQVRKQKIMPLVCILSMVIFMLLATGGHTAAHHGIMAILQIINQTAHLLSLAYWCGGLVAFLFCLFLLHQSSLRSDVINALRRFSLWGHAMVIVVIVTGFLSACFIYDSWPDLSFNLYQNILIIKIILVSLMVIIALLNRYSFVPRFSVNKTLVRNALFMGSCGELILAFIAIIMACWLAMNDPFASMVIL